MDSFFHTGQDNSPYIGTRWVVRSSKDVLAAHRFMSRLWILASIPVEFELMSSLEIACSSWTSPEVLDSMRLSAWFSLSWWASSSVTHLDWWSPSVARGLWVTTALALHFWGLHNDAPSRMRRMFVKLGPHPTIEEDDFLPPFLSFLKWLSIVAPRRLRNRAWHSSEKWIPELCLDLCSKAIDLK